MLLCDLIFSSSMTYIVDFYAQSLNIVSNFFVTLGKHLNFNTNFIRLISGNCVFLYKAQNLSIKLTETKLLLQKVYLHDKKGYNNRASGLKKLSL